MSKIRRKTFVAREDLLNRLGESAKRRGYHLYEFINELFNLAIEAEELGVNLRRILEERGILNAARKSGFILELENLSYEMAEIAYEKDREKAVKSWFEAGVWLAKRYVTGTFEDPFQAFKRDLENFTWNAPEFTIKNLEGKVIVRIISPRFTESYTILFASLLEGALETFNLKIDSKEVSRGSIRLEASRKESNVQEE